MCCLGFDSIKYIVVGDDSLGTLITKMLNLLQTA